MNAARNAAAMVTEEEYAKIVAMSKSGARRHILFSLEQTICEMRPAISA
jgi:response regulator of citrate/malate metabolism